MIEIEARRIWIEIDGWGVVRRPADLLTYTVVGDEIRIPVADTAWTSADIGCTIQLADTRGPAFETRGVYLGVTGPNHVVRIIDDGQFIGTGTALGEVTRAWIDDHYRLCNDLPPWPLGSFAQGQWEPVLADVTRILGERFEPGGGVAPAQSVTVDLLYDDDPGSLVSRLPRTWTEPMGAAAGGLSFLTQRLAWDSDTVVLGAPAAAAPRVVWVGTEAVYLDNYGASNNAIRGVLRTQPQFHPRFSGVLDEMPTAAGQVVRVFTADEDAQSIADARLRFVGVVDSFAFLEDLSALRLSCLSISALEHSLGADKRQTVTLKEASVREATAAEASAWGALPGTSARLGFSFFVESEGTTDEQHRWALFGEAVAYALQPLTLDVDDVTRGFELLRRAYIFAGLYPQSFAGVVGGMVVDGNAAQLIGDVEEYRDVQRDIRTIDPRLARRSFPVTGPRFVRLPGAETFVGASERLDSTGRLVRDPVPNALQKYASQGAQFGWLFTSGPPPGARQAAGQGWSPAAFAEAGVPVANDGQHIVDVVLAVLTSTGTGRNTFEGVDAGPFPGALTPQGQGFGFANWDYLPASFGLGTPASLVDLRSFYAFAHAYPDAFVRGLWLGQDDAQSTAQWLSEHVLQPYGVALSTGRDGRIVLVDTEAFVSGEDFEDLPVISDVDLWTDSEGIPRNGHVTGPLTLSSGASLEQTDYSIPDQARRVQRAREVSGSEAGGLASPIARVGRHNRATKVERGAVDVGAWSARMRRWLVRGRDVVSRVTLEMRDDQAPAVGEVVFLQGIPVYPNPQGLRSLSGVAQVEMVDVDIYTALAVVTLLVHPRAEQPLRDRWAPGGLVTGATSGSNFTVALNTWIPTTEAGAPPSVNRFASDPEALLPGSALVLVDAFFELRDTGGVVQSVNTSTGAVTLSPGFTVTPDPGDIVLLDVASTQTATVRTQWAFADGDSTWR